MPNTRKVAKQHKKTSFTVLELVDYLQKHRFQMPGTMLRYAIEKFGPERRKYFLSRLE